VNLLDENIPDGQRDQLRHWRIRVQKLGRDVATKGIQDDQVVPLLQSLTRVTFFTLDRDFADPSLCHSTYCLVYLDVADDEVARFVRRILQHPNLNTHAKRMGAVVRASHVGVRIWRRNVTEQQFAWPGR
jgi:hypothetical protein